MADIIPSEFQGAIYHFAEYGTGNGVVGAVAGSGKTHTLREVAKLIKTGNAIFLAFNVHVVEELNTRLKGSGIVAKTVNGAGMGAVIRVLGKVVDMQSVESKKKYDRLATTWVDVNGKQFAPDERKEIAGSLTKLVNFARMTLVDASNADALNLMCLHSDIEVKYPSFLFPAVPVILQQGQDVARRNKVIDFTDQIWLPIVWNLPVAQYNFVLGDEIQDWSKCQTALVEKMIAPSGRFLGCGDRRQSIMAFAGADSRSFDNIRESLKATELPLSICYRCPTSHLALARMIVPEIQARPNAPVGEVLHIKPTDELAKFVKGGDLIICRLTAPLVSECIKLIKNRIAAKVRGKAIGYELTALLRRIGKLEGFSYDNAVAHLQEYKARRIEFLRQKEADESAIESLCDRIECLQVCAESYLNATSIDQLAKEIDNLFDENRPAVWLSTVHRAKGLEADRVFILKPEKLPLRWKNQQVDQFQQELNIAYVALTRAKETLFFVGDLPDVCQREDEVKPATEALEASLGATEMVLEPMVELAGWNACYSCGSVLASPTEQQEGVCDFCAGWTYNVLPPEDAYPVASVPMMPESTTELDAAIACLNALVHDNHAMYHQDKIREAAEEVARLWSEFKDPIEERRAAANAILAEYEDNQARDEAIRRNDESCAAFVRDNAIAECCPICGKELLEEDEFLYCPEHGGPLSSLVKRQREREEEWKKEAGRAADYALDKGEELAERAKERWLDGPEIHDYE